VQKCGSSFVLGAQRSENGDIIVWQIAVKLQDVSLAFLGDENLSSTQSCALPINTQFLTYTVHSFLFRFIIIL